MDQMQILINQTLDQLTKLRLEQYMSEFLFSWRWWLFLGLFVVPWYIWWRLVDKKNLKAIIICGLILAILNSIIDEHLVNLGLYTYKYHLDPIWGGILTAELTVPPIAGMLLYQYFPKWNMFTLVTLIACAILSFIALPIYKLLGVIVMFKWTYLHSFGLLVILELFAKWITDLIVRIELRQSSRI